MSETNTTDSNTYHEVNINRYSELQYGGARLYTNGNGDVLLTPSYVTAEQINSGANPPVYYDMNRLVIEKNGPQMLVALYDGETLITSEKACEIQTVIFHCRFSY